jgi:anti-anti-sigma factor
MHENTLNRTRTQATIANADDSCALTVDCDQGVHIFHITGIIDARSQRLLDDLLQKAEAPGVRVDFAGVKRINSMGIALLLRCFKKIKDNKHAEIRLLNLNQINTMLFRITGIFLLASPEEESPKGYVQ